MLVRKCDSCHKECDKLHRLTFNACCSIDAKTQGMKSVAMNDICDACLSSYSIASLPGRIELFIAASYWAIRDDLGMDSQGQHPAVIQYAMRMIDEMLTYLLNEPSVTEDTNGDDHDQA